MNHSFDIELAKQFGVNEAIFIENLRFWVAKNKANNKHFHDGHYWTYNSMKAYAELFPYWTTNQVRRIIENLVTNGLIVVGNYNSSPYDRTQWYALNEQIEVANLPNETVKNAKSTNSTDINTVTKETAPNGFDMFWSAYPLKVSKIAAKKAWVAAKVSEQQIPIILKDIDQRKQTDKWLKNKGQFIPNPDTYIRNRRWEDELEIENLSPVFAGAI